MTIYDPKLDATSSTNGRHSKIRARPAGPGRLQGTAIFPVAMVTSATRRRTAAAPALGEQSDVA